MPFDIFLSLSYRLYRLSASMIRQGPGSAVDSIANQMAEYMCPKSIVRASYGNTGQSSWVLISALLLILLHS